MPFYPFIVPQFDTNAHLRAQLDELNKPYPTFHPSNSVRSIVDASPSFREGIKQSDRQDKIHEIPVHRPTGLSSSFTVDNDPVYSPGPIEHTNLPRREALSPASSPDTGSTDGQSEEAVTSDEELPEDLAWIFNYKDAPVLWVSGVAFVLRMYSNLAAPAGLSICL